MSVPRVMLLIVTTYMVTLAAISFVVRRSCQTADGFASGGRAFPCRADGAARHRASAGTAGR